jgi:NAD-dependent SIR2 family protein deacetylase
MTIQHAAELLSSARRGLALTGAGVSAESGIPTFRGEGGLWTKYDPVKVASINYFMADPAAYWKVSKERGNVALAARRLLASNPKDTSRPSPRRTQTGCIRTRVASA